jgi:hypothetical protein
MAHQSLSRLRVLHAVRLRGFADADTVALLADVDGVEAAAVLAELAAEGLANKREGRLSGWTLTPDGRANHAKIVAAELDAAGCRAEVEDAYRRFLAVNQNMLGCCTQWQLRTVRGEQVPNDHSDPAHDAAAIAALGVIDDAVQPVCADLGAAFERFADYGSRLSTARRKVEAGENEFFTKPLIDSYHTVWFELHEDLLVTLGIERSKEGSA